MSGFHASATSASAWCFLDDIHVISSTAHSPLIDVLIHFCMHCGHAVEPTLADKDLHCFV